MQEYHYYDTSTGTWVNLCNNPISIYDANGNWKKIDPNISTINYYNGTAWKYLECPVQPLGLGTEINIWAQRDSSGAPGAQQYWNYVEDATNTFFRPIVRDAYYNGSDYYANGRIRYFSAGPFGNYYYQRFLRSLGRGRGHGRGGLDLAVTRVINIVFTHSSEPYVNPDDATFNRNQIFQEYVQDVVELKSNVKRAETEGYDPVGPGAGIHPNNLYTIRGVTVDVLNDTFVPWSQGSRGIVPAAFGQLTPPGEYIPLVTLKELYDQKRMTYLSKYPSYVGGLADGNVASPKLNGVAVGDIQGQVYYYWQALRYAFNKMGIFIPNDV